MAEINAEQPIDENLQPLTLQFDPTTRLTQILGLPNYNGITFILPDGIDVQSLYTRLYHDPAAQLLLSSMLVDVMDRFLATQTPQNQTLEPKESDIIPHEVPKWATIGIPSLQLDVSRFYDFLHLDDGERGLMQLLGGVLSLQYWWRENLLLKPEAIAAKKSFAENALPYICDYVKYFEQIGKLDNDQAQRYLMQLEEIKTTILAMSNLDNPLKVLITESYSDKNGLLPRLVEYIIFTSNPQRVDRLAKAVADIKNRSISNQREVSEVLADAQLTNSRDFIEKSLIEFFSVLPVSATQCRSAFIFALSRALEQRVVEIQINIDHILPNSQRLLGR